MIRTETGRRLQALATRSPALPVADFATLAGITCGELDRYLRTSWLRIVSPAGGSFTGYIVRDDWMQEGLTTWFGYHPGWASDICDGTLGSDRRRAAEHALRGRAAELESLRARMSA